MNKITKLEFIEKYGHQYVRFSEYYKYVFTFKNDLSDHVVMVFIGGDASEIYREQIFANQWVKIEEMRIFSGIVLERGIAVEEFYDEL